MAEVTSEETTGPEAAGPGPTRGWVDAPLRRAPRASHLSVSTEEGDGSSWAIPYTDLTMLLMVFFIVMLTIVGPNPSEETTRAKARNSAQSAPPALSPSVGTQTAATGPLLVQGGDGLLPGQAPRDDVDPLAPTRAEPTTPPQAKPVTPPDTSPPPLTDEELFAREWARRLAVLETVAERYLQHAQLDETVQLLATEKGVELRLPDDKLFTSGSADMEAGGRAIIAGLAELLRDVEGDIVVEGHTDNVPIQTLRFPSNWELSAARAIEVVRHLRDLGVGERKMQAVGHGANRPIATNRTANGRATNRRVTIRITPRPSGT